MTKSDRSVSGSCAEVLNRPAEWKLVIDGPRPGEENMRRDLGLLESQRETGAAATVRIYRWSEPTVSYGRLQAETAAEALSAVLGGRAVVQRPTGGGMVFHESDLSFSVAWRRDNPAVSPCVKNVYRFFHQALADEFCSRGMNVSLFQAGGARQTPPGACYQEFTQDDILWEGRKLVGGALRVTSGARLYQGNFKPPSGGWRDDWEKTITKAFETGVFRCAAERSQL